MKGRLSWSMDRDENGRRQYKLTSLVKCTSTNDGPNDVMNASGLPSIGSTWSFGGDSDPWAYCLPTMTCNPIVENEPNRWWKVEQTFATTTAGEVQRCQDTNVDNPLQEPDRVSGSFSKRSREVTKDYTGKDIRNSSFELIYGIERDFSDPTVTIEQNRSALGLSTFAAMIDTLNDAPLWGLPRGLIKLGNTSWTRNVFGSCSFYYTRRFEFEVRYEGWQRDDIVDAGFKKVKSGGDVTDPDPTNWVIIQDGQDRNMPTKSLLHNGTVMDKTTYVGNGGQPDYIDEVLLYSYSNFLLLGIPTVF